MELEQLKNENKLINLFCTLAEIPSPSLQEEKVIEYICKYCEDERGLCDGKFRQQILKKARFYYQLTWMLSETIPKLKHTLTETL